ncbi:UNVERIFIED_CONTAM: hypothetical protein FKN15_046708 [Acipenser sinensis]
MQIGGVPSGPSRSRILMAEFGKENGGVASSQIPGQNPLNHGDEADRDVQCAGSVSNGDCGVGDMLESGSPATPGSPGIDIANNTTAGLEGKPGTPRRSSIIKAELEVLSSGSESPSNAQVLSCCHIYTMDVGQGGVLYFHASNTVPHASGFLISGSNKKAHKITAYPTELRKLEEDTIQHNK